MKVLRFISRIIVGLVFMFSGAVKAVDPMGSAYKFNDYFQAFNLEFLQPASLLLAILLVTAEFASGFSVLSGYRQKFGIWGVMILMAIFTPLTLVLALTNPVSDCGCFGDAIHLTNWQTFWKNAIIIVFTIIVFTGRNKIKHIASQGKEWVIISSVAALFIIFSLLNLRYLQLFDFLPYKTGTNIPDAMIVPEGKPVDEYETTFIYEKEGIQKEFTLENYPANDTTWKFVDQNSILVKKGYQPPIHDFSLVTVDGYDVTDMILANSNYTLLMISTRLDDADIQHLKAGFDLGERCIAEGISFYVVTASGTDEILKYNNGLTFCSADEITLKTIVRSNPGYMLLKDGNIAGKWSRATLPDKEEFTGNMTGEQVKEMNRKSPVLVVYSVSFLALIMLLIISRVLVGRKNGSDQL